MKTTDELTIFKRPFSWNHPISQRCKSDPYPKSVQGSGRNHIPWRGFRCIQGSFHYIQGSMNSASSGPWTLNASLLSKDWDVWASSSLGSHGHTSTKRMPGLGSPIRFILSRSLRIKVERPKILFGVAAKKPKNSQNNKKGRVRIPKTCRQLTWWFGPNRHVRNDRWGFRARLKVSQIIILGVNSLS
jgi:hypothetical protein